MLQYFESRRVKFAAIVAVFAHVGMCAMALT